MLLTDSPIKTKKEDLLNRSGFAEKLGERLLDWTTQDGIVIGLSGGWGMGKSSIINLAIEYINKKTKKLKKEDKPITINFNPWNFTEQNQLITVFLNELAKAIGYQDNSEDAKKVGQELITYSKFFLPLTVIPPIAPFALLFENVFKSVGEATRGWGELKSKTVEQFKNELDKKIKKLNKKIIIVIDDIDRLNSLEIRQIFQLVKLNANFPNTLYVLCFDQQKVINALGDEYKLDNDYLEKIIQVAFQVPALERIRLEKVLFAELDKILKPLDIEKRWDVRRWGNLYYDGMGELFTSLRHVKRYVNSLHFNISHLPHEINEIDFMGLEAMRVFASDVYEAISKNKELFTGTTSSYGSSNDKESRKTQIEEIISRAKEKHQKSTRKIIQFLFPQMESIYGNTYYGDDWQSRWSKEKRICASDRFDKYFFMALPEGEVSQEDMDMVIKNSGDTSKIESFLRQLNKEKRIRRFLDRLPEFVDDVPEANMEAFILAVFNVSDAIPRETKGMFDVGIDMQCIRVGYHLLKRVEDSAKRLEIIEKVIQKTTSLDVPTQFVHLEKPKDKGENEAPRLVDADGYNKIKAIALDKIKTSAISKKLQSSPHLNYMLYAWKEWGSEAEAKQFVQDMILTPLGLARFLEGFMSQTSSLGMKDKVSVTKWKIEPSSISLLIGLDTVEKQVKSITSVQKKKLTVRQREALDLFMQSYEESKKKTENDRVIVAEPVTS